MILNDNTETLLLLGGLFKCVSTEYTRKYYFCGIKFWSSQVSSLEIVRAEIEKSNLHNAVANIENSIKKTSAQLTDESKKFGTQIDALESSLDALNSDLNKKIKCMEERIFALSRLLEKEAKLLQQENLSIKQDVKSNYQAVKQYVAGVENKILGIDSKLDIVNRFIKTSSTIKFNDETLPLMKYGFYNVESWGCWLQKYAMLFIKVLNAQTDVHLTFSLNCFHAENEKTLSVWANGKKLGQYLASQGDNEVNITVSKFNIPENGFISLEFITDKLESPQELFDESDTRSLGFGLIEMAADTEIILFDLDKDLFHALYQQRHSCQFKNEEWSAYFNTHDVERELLMLKQNLSEDNQSLIDVFYGRRCAPYVFSAYEFEQHELVLAQDISKYKITNQTGFQPEVFYFKNGLKFIDDKIIRQHLIDKDVIDGGACTGDSALMFAEYKFINKIYSFEPIKTSYENLKKTLEVNNCFKAEAIHKALSNQDGSTEIMGEICQTITVDSFAKDKKIGCIKFDLEGMETKALRGAEATIKRDKPLLLICLYHTPEDFFGIKPLIESWNLGYKFKIADTEPCNNAIGMHLTLIAYQE